MHPSPSREPETLAAVDLGSNSFHMIIARYRGHDLQIFDRLREPVRLAAGLDDDRMLSEEAQARALECLERFGQRLRGIDDPKVRAVATNTMRRARNARDFAEKAYRALGTEIEVISGAEEARLIYLGVAQSHSSGIDRRLVVDIGGGSTEIIIGKGFDVLEAHSLYMGCVGMSQRFFREGRLDRDHFRQAETAAGLELQSLERPMRDLGWEHAIGASGTVNAIGEVMRQNGFTDRSIDLAGMKKLRKALVRFGTLDRVRLRGLQPARLPVLPGGLAILIAIFRRLEIERMDATSGALREGVLYDLVGRIRHEDIRDRTIRRFTEQYHADRGQAARVERTALNLLAQARPDWPIDHDEAARLLGWSSLLHETGLAVAYAGYHRHGAYLIEHSVMPGFSSLDQKQIADLVHGHRRKLTGDLFAEHSGPRRELLLRLCVLLRIAVLLHRGRGPAVVPRLSVHENWARVELTFPSGWFEEHPLTRADLEQEQAYLQDVGIRLDLTLENAPSSLPSTTR